MASFEREQARWFFGRGELTATLIARLDERLRTGGVQVVVAPSGAGKSSLLHAGLLAKLESGALPGSSQWPTVVFSPTAHPLAALDTHLTALLGADPQPLAEKLAAGLPSAGTVLDQVLLKALGGQDSGARLVVIVDQFEELFTLCTDDQQRCMFIDVLTRLASPRSGTETDAHPLGLVVVGVRADFYAACANNARLRAALEDNPLVVGPMSDPQLREAILYPAQDVGLDVEAGLVELLLRDIGDGTIAANNMITYEAGRLPLLAHTLRATWQQRHGHTLTVEGYRSTGGIPRAVATTADRIFTRLDSASQHAARSLFLRLIKIGDDTEDTRRRVARTDLLQGLYPASVGPVLDAFTQARLLTQDQDTVEITHEALLRAWPQLRQWIDTDRAGHLIRQDLEGAAAAWDRDRQDNAGLYRGSRLETVRTWAASHADEGDLSPAASAFLAASAAQERRTARSRRAVLVVLAVLALVASGAAGVAFHQRATAQQERDNATFNQIIAQADQLRSTDVSLAAQLDLVAYRMRPTSDLRTALLSDANAPLSTPLTDHANEVRAVAFSPDGHTLATGSLDQTVRLWNVTDPTHPTSVGTPLTTHANALAFSPDARILATGGDQTVRLWNVTNPAHPTPLGPPLTGHPNGVYAVAFSPDGHTLATGSADGTVRLWNVTNPAYPTPLRPPLTGHTSWGAVAFSPDPNRLTLVIGSGDGTVRLWNLTDPTHPLLLGSPLTGHTDSVFAVAFSPNGHTLATGSLDRTVRLWNVTNPTHPTPLGAPLTDHTNWIGAVAFNRDGHILATGSADRTVRLWNLTYPTHPLPLGQALTGHTNIVRAVAFSPNGHTMATGSNDYTARLWNISAALTIGHTDTVSAVAFNPEGRTLATGSADGTVRLWNVTNPAYPTPLGPPLTGHIPWVRAVAFSPEGHTLATGSDDVSVRLWNATNPAHPTPLDSPLTGHTNIVRAVAFSPNGHTMATGSDDQTVRLWNVTNPANPTPLGQPLTGHTNWVGAVAFSRNPDGKHILATGSLDRTVRLWNVANPVHPTLLGQFPTGHTGPVYPVVFSPDGHTLATGSLDQTVRLWNVTNPANPTPLGQPLTGHTDRVFSVAFSPDGQTLASGGADRTIRLWEINADEAIRRIYATTANTITKAKWKQYVSPNLPYHPPCL